MSNNNYSISELAKQSQSGTNYHVEVVENAPVSIADGLNHKGKLGVEYMMPVSLDGWQLPNEPLISATGKKKIVETPLVGNSRRGTVKELINTEDYEIKIQGIILNEVNEAYPEEEVSRLIELYEKNESVLIVNELTRLLEVSQVVIRSLDLPLMTGMQNAQRYTLNCVSDEDFILVKS